MINKYLIGLFILTSVIFTNAQVMSFPFQMEIGLGTSVYHGDLSKGTAGIKPDFGAQVGLKYYLSTQLTFIPRLGYARFSAADASQGDPLRNLSFRSDVYYASLNMEFDFYHFVVRSPRKFWPYLIGGIGAMRFDPKAELNGEYIALQPLQTEGDSYSRFSAIVPVGTGFWYKVVEGLEIGAEFTWTLTFTDYLDDVSGNYVDNDFLNGNAALLADRTYETGNIPTNSSDGVHWADGSQRGKSAFFDSFSSLMFSVKFNIYKSSVVCPH